MRDDAHVAATEMIQVIRLFAAKSDRRVQSSQHLLTRVDVVERSWRLMECRDKRAALAQWSGHVTGVVIRVLAVQEVAQPAADEAARRRELKCKRPVVVPGHRGASDEAPAEPRRKTREPVDLHRLDVEVALQLAVARMGAVMADVEGGDGNVHRASVA